MKLLAPLLFCLMANTAHADAQIKDFSGKSIVLSEVSSKQLNQISNLVEAAFSKADLTRGDCFNRALAIGASLKKSGFNSAKIFLQGRLKPIYFKDGTRQDFEFHVANLVLSDKQFFMIDPIISFEPIPLKEWLAKFAEIEKIKVRYDGKLVIRLQNKSTLLDVASENQLSPPCGEDINEYHEDDLKWYCERNAIVCQSLNPDLTNFGRPQM